MTFLVSNLDGAFALLGISSRYNGVFFSDGSDVFRAIADIRPQLVQPSYQRHKVYSESGSWWFVYKVPAFFYECAGASDIFFDCKKNFDNREWGRVHDVFVEGDVCFVHFKKLNDPREPAGEEYSFWLCLHGCAFERVEKWVDQKLEFDEARKSPPFSRFIFHGVSAKGSFVCAFASTKEGAKKLALDSWKNRIVLEREAKAKAVEFSGGDNFGSALECARYSLSCLRSNSMLFAGLPWFHQRWARDELVCVKGLVLSNQKALAKAIILHWLDKLLPKGKLPGTLTDTIADVGWLFVRCEDILPSFSRKEKVYVLAKVDYFLSKIGKSLEHGLVVNEARETWMDSIDRQGSRIEINMLALAACRLFRKLQGMHPLEEKLKSAVKASFFKEGYLWDGSFDRVVRPNSFIAAYVYPELLSVEEWIGCFDSVLPKLWCEWGGLSSVDKDSKQFVQDHTGEDPASYHNGDSWFWLNNLAGIVLNRLDSKRYSSYVKGILQASATEILTMGAIGHHAELSSASRLESNGCPVQAWSAALFVELSEELAKNKNR